ncbi:hypothetical protein [Paenibacillus larvae]|uniref:hypothetical protein n=1 Tax=Paenibacillus larvae TaxID=1464 RepID=UPI00228143EA|nr:hypothetical protein [Paenibacillus larvae]MEB8593752.1 hypothetical protein [Bacillus cereus]MCY7521045.1 hypothetical protein [Paenibacillus larvae]MCY9523820.1 hypothetical protein [Paenibacillus larvae]MCY9677537.1 hypothetical protein [Paenibacillus larvae]MCY9744716.1 hypothetical protein [Paenibacillus larvae]
MKKLKKWLLSIAVVATILGSEIALNTPQVTPEGSIAIIHGFGESPAVFTSAIHGTEESRQTLG